MLGEDQPIEILRIVHAPESDCISLAVLMPAIGFLGDASKWWVFDRPYRVADADPSSDERAREPARHCG